MIVRIGGTFGGAKEVEGRGVVHRIHTDRSAADLGAQCVDESLPDKTDAGRIVGAAGEDHLDVGTPLGRRRWNTVRRERQRDDGHRGGE